MAPPNTRDDISTVRQMHQALVLHYIEGKTQAEIAKELGISHATVNRLIKRGHQLGLVEIKIKSPIDHLVDLEARLVSARRHRACRRGADGLGQTRRRPCCESARRRHDLLLETIKDGDTISITGGKGVSALVAGLKPGRGYDVEVIPATGWCRANTIPTSIMSLR